MPPQPVEAEAVGQWAVHYAYCKTKIHPAFTVTHAPSDAAAKQGIPLEEARRLAKQLAERVPAFDTMSGEPWLKAVPIIKEVVHGNV